MKLKKKLLAAIWGGILLSLAPFIPSASAEIKTITADGYYTIGDGSEESVPVAKQCARADAKRVASERACVYV